MERCLTTILAADVVGYSRLMGANVAARLEGVARPGGIAVSHSVRELIGNKLDLAFTDRGDEQLKNRLRIPTSIGCAATRATRN